MTMNVIYLWSEEVAQNCNPHPPCLCPPVSAGAYFLRPKINVVLELKKSQNKINIVLAFQYNSTFISFLFYPPRFMRTLYYFTS